VPIDLSFMPSSSSVTPKLVPFLCGYYLKDNDEMLAVIDGKIIIAERQKLQQQDLSIFRSVA
jgi:hypothetical protein